ncbi:MAG: O-methyltransferase [bacterium]
MSKEKQKHTVVGDKGQYINRNYNLKYDKYLLTMKEYAKNNDVPIMEDGGIAFLISVLKMSKTKKVLEIGSAIGFSASCMAKLANCDVTTIEIDDERYNECINNINNQNLNDKVRCIHKDALLAYEDVKDEEFDFIFIDAAKGQYANFFELYEKNLKEGGIILTDNLYFHDLLFQETDSRNLHGLLKRVHRYNDYLLSKEGYDTTILEIGDGIGISIKK